MRTAAVLALALLCLGCLGKPLHKEYPEKRAFALDVARPGAPRPAPLARVLLVGGLSAAEGYQAKGLVYKTGERTFESDFYNEFFVPPVANVGQEVAQWLGASGLFASVVDASSRLFASHALEGRVVLLHGDYSGAQPAAVLELQILVTDEGETPPSIAFQGTYRERVTLAAKEPALLVAGWCEGLAHILARLEDELARALGAG